MRESLGSICLVILVLSAGCSEKSCEPCPGGFVYPLRIGNRWEYASIDSSFNHRPHSLSPVDYVFRDTSVVECTRMDTLPQDVETHVLHESGRGKWGVSESETHYTNERDGLYIRAFVNSPDVVPFRLPDRSLVFRGREFEDAAQIIDYIELGLGPPRYAEDSLRIYDPPIWKFRYPLRIGTRWVPSYTGLWPVEMGVVDETTVDVPAGTFECLVIETLVDIDEDGEWDADLDYLEFVCDKGLVRRHVFAKDIAATDEHGDTLGLFDLIMNNDLIDTYVR